MVSLSLCLPSSIYLQAKDLKFESVRKAISRLDLTTTSPLIKSSLLLKACIRSGNLELGKLLHHKLIDSGLPLDSVLLNSLQLHSCVIRSRLASDVFVGCTLVDMYAKSAAVENSRKIFNTMLRHNVMSWTALISGYVQSRQEQEAIKLFCNMLHGHVAPNSFTFSSVLKACASLPDFGIGKQLHGQTIKLGLSTINCVGNSLINMYARSGTMECARKAFNILFEKNLISYNTAVDANAKALDSDESFNHEVEHTGVGASSYTYACLLSGAACIGTIVKGEQIHALIVKSGFGTNLCINNALISMYSKCGNKEAALQVFNDMGYRNVITWTSIISGFAKHGFATKALELFYEMLEIGVKPNEVTYIAVLSACSHVGLIDEAWKHFNSMHYNHSISPRMEHYACMVDLLGRSGLLLEAIEFINSMPFDADALVWRTFLGSCRVHRNTKLGEHAAKKILEREPHDPATYILLSNLYASEGRWDDVAALRKSMKQKKLIKETGYSWIEVDNQVHKFHVGDTSHPQARKIYDELDELALKIKNLGYIPNTDFVLHDVEDEQKEQYLFQHSEKIAVAYALISTPKPKPIRVFKNLRVCGDCHTAIKYISIVTGREIVVRDANRFHHIKDGKCSCNDYW
ncbi:Pentatricopeptide repeat-containing protein, chloroplastic [Glycine soja]|uniref:Pentatricopeptide repeat-containing protein, chloroplastic n=1 Tax=Glycine soja TaxID=3848 RepID=A0A0B2Q531_GLYSO|nr:Pentatricopeptide repeat-containing protein, chloroplastic [Glycine soja]